MTTHTGSAASTAPTAAPHHAQASNAPSFEGFCLWLTGLPSAGKTTIGTIIQKQLHDQGYRVELLDGDEIRRGLSSDLGFDRAAREAHARRVTFVAKVLARNGVIPIVTLISPYRASRAAARAEIGRFIEVYVSTPTAVCEERDVKGLYKKARAGLIKDMTGVDDPYEAPESPEILVQTVGETPDGSAAFIVAELRKKGLLPAN
jgi:adenylylsulfate kinase